MPLSRYSGMFDPADLAIMQRVFDTVCKERRLALKDKKQREDLAADIIREFAHGTTDEADVLRAISKRRKD
jgi:hypothetical protein